MPLIYTIPYLAKIQWCTLLVQKHKKIKDFTFLKLTIFAHLFWRNNLCSFYRSFFYTAGLPHFHIWPMGHIDTSYRRCFHRKLLPYHTSCIVDDPEDKNTPSHPIRHRSPSIHHTSRMKGCMKEDGFAILFSHIHS